MDKIRSITAAILISMFALTVTCVGQSSATPKADNPEAQEVLKVVRRFQEAGVKGDTATLLQIFDPNVTHFHPGSPYRFVGATRLANEFEIAAKSVQDMRFEMVDPDIQFPAKDVAVATYYIVESWADKNGVRTNVKEKASEVYVKKNGTWMMIHGHYSAE